MSWARRILLGMGEGRGGERRGEQSVPSPTVRVCCHRKGTQEGRGAWDPECDIPRGEPWAKLVSLLREGDWTPPAKASAV